MHTKKPLQKRYLTGIDWVVNTLDSMTKAAGGHGNSSQIILETETPLAPGRLREALDRLARALPVIYGRVARGWNLCPYWKVNSRPPHRVPLSVREIKNDNFCEALSVLKAHVNQRFENNSEHLRFLILNSQAGRSFLAMHFDHRLLDAFGAETFLELIEKFDRETENEVINRINLTESHHLDQWSRRFKGGRNTNRMQLKLSREGLAALPVKPHSGNRSTHFRIICFSEEETGLIREKLNAASGGFALALPSLLAYVMEPLHNLIEHRGCGDTNYVVPVSVVRRTPDEIWEKLFFNHISFVFFQIPVGLAAFRDELTRNLQNQLYSQIKENLPDDIYHAGMLTRIAPLPVMRLLSKIPVKGKVATNYFACLKESGFSSSSFLDAGVKNLIHTPHVPVPPGLGLFFNFFQNRLNLVISHLEGLIPEEEARALADKIKEKLLL